MAMQSTGFSLPVMRLQSYLRASPSSASAASSSSHFPSSIAVNEAPAPCCRPSEHTDVITARAVRITAKRQAQERRRPLVTCSLSADDEEAGISDSRRSFLLTMTLAAASLGLGFFAGGQALAVKQNLLAGRIPGLSPPDESGLRTYRRPDAKSGGHGVGWSPIIPYSFKVPEDWEEVPVSIADLGGTEIDLRFSSRQEGNISVVVAPVLRFASDLGDDAKIEAIGPPEKVIDAFGPELVGQNVEGQVQDMEVVEHDGRTYYLYELKIPHVLITATAAGNRLYLMTVSGNARQWKKYGEGLKQIAGSFRVG